MYMKQDARLCDALPPRLHWPSMQESWLLPF